MNDSTIRRRSVANESAFTVGIALFGIMVALGGIAGAVMTAATSEIGELYDSTTLTDYTAHASDAGKFNWLIFLAFAIAGAICFTICYATAVICTQLAANKATPPPGS